MWRAVILSVWGVYAGVWLCDATMTVVLVRYGFVREVNPIMSRAIDGLGWGAWGIGFVLVVAIGLLALNAERGVMPIRVAIGPTVCPVVRSLVVTAVVLAVCLVQFAIYVRNWLHLIS